MNFSIVLIAKNEEKTLPRLLGSLSEFQKRGGEVILVDTGSTDNTAKVAKELGCKVYEEGTRFLIEIDRDLATQIYDKFTIDGEPPVVQQGDKLFDYASARNYAASLASNSICAMPDCDEIYTSLNLDAINALILEGIEQFEYNFVFSHDEFGNEVIKFAHSKFYDRTKMNWVGVVHEVLNGQVKRTFVQEDIIKLEHYQNVETNRTGYLKGLAVDCFKNPMNDRNSHYFAREMLWTGRPKSAIAEFMRHLEISYWNAERSQSMIYIGDAFSMLGDNKLAVEWWQRAFTEDSSRREPLMRLAEFYMKQSDAQKVVSYCAAALEIPWNNFYANFHNHYTNTPHEYMYWAYWQLGDKEKSEEHFAEAFDFQPFNSKYLHDYRFYEELPTVSFIIPTLGRPEGLQRCLDSIKNLNYLQEKIEVIVLDGEGTVPEKVEKGRKQAKNEFIVYGANDVEFTPDSLIIALTQNKYNYSVIAFNTGEVWKDEGNICEHFIIASSFAEKIGGIFDTDFHHVGVDNLLWAKAKKYGVPVRCKEAVVKHYHFTHGAPMDEIYELAYSKKEQDRELLKVKLAQL